MTATLFSELLFCFVFVCFERNGEGGNKRRERHKVLTLTPRGWLGEKEVSAIYK